MTINIVDTNNFGFHMAFTALNKNLGVSQIEDFVRINTVYLLSGAFLNKSVEKAKYLFVGDSKPYWRYNELKDKFGVIYKGKKGSGNERYSEVLPLILTCLEKCLAKQDIFVAYKEEYEADDIAAFVVNECASLHTPINLITSDQDWIPLIGVNAATTWVSTKEVNQRVVNARNCMQFFHNHKTYNSTKAKKEFPKESIFDLWKFKATFGDTSDNIPADKSGSMKFLPYIDLRNPLPQFDLKLQPDKTKDIMSYVSKAYPQVKFEQFIGNRKLPYPLALNRVE